MSNADKNVFIKDYFGNIKSILDNIPIEKVVSVISLLEAAYQDKRQIFIAGNGGSASTASHMANDFMMGVAKKRDRGFKAISLSDSNSIITAVANDNSYEEIFSAQLVELGNKDDILIVFSGSGNSPNIVRVVEMAKKIKIKTIAFLGRNGGDVGKIADLCIVVPAEDYGPIEDIHLIFDHLITTYFLKQPLNEATRVKNP